MGYLVVAHAMNVMPDLEPLSTLPTSNGWSLHQDESATSFYLDTFKAGEERKRLCHPSSMYRLSSFKNWQRYRGYTKCLRMLS